MVEDMNLDPTAKRFHIRSETVDGRVSNTIGNTIQARETATMSLKQHLLTLWWHTLLDDYHACPDHIY